MTDSASWGVMIHGWTRRVAQALVVIDKRENAPSHAELLPRMRSGKPLPSAISWCCAMASSTELGKPMASSQQHGLTHMPTVAGQIHGLDACERQHQGCRKLELANVMQSAAIPRSCNAWGSRPCALPMRRHRTMTLTGCSALRSPTPSDSSTIVDSLHCSSSCTHPLTRFSLSMRAMAGLPTAGQFAELPGRPRQTADHRLQAPALLPELFSVDLREIRSGGGVALAIERGTNAWLHARPLYRRMHLFHCIRITQRWNATDLVQPEFTQDFELRIRGNAKPIDRKWMVEPAQIEHDVHADAQAVDVHQMEGSFLPLQECCVSVITG